MVVLTLEVPPGVYPGHLIGAKGQNIRTIKDFYGVKIDYQPNKKRYVPNNGTAKENFVAS